MWWPATGCVVALALAGTAGVAAAQANAPPASNGDPTPADSALADSAVAREPVFRFSSEAGLGLRALWEDSHAAMAERVACIGATISNDTVFVGRILALEPHDADSMSVSSAASVERCGPPQWN